MTNDTYAEVVFNNVADEKLDVLIALLVNDGYDGFDESGNGLKAYIIQDFFDKGSLDRIVKEQQLEYNVNVITPQNWNALWEENFEPVTIENFVVVRASFHAPAASSVEHEIVITPKMSFGTGHHATTYMMIAQMQQLHFLGKQVFDFGTGTGILAILAEKLGATEIVAVDNDEWSITNAAENFAQNNCSVINLQQAETAQSGRQFDIILANINKNVILDNVQYISRELYEGGYILLSGLLAADEQEILAKAMEEGLTHLNTMHRLQWISILFSR